MPGRGQPISFPGFIPLPRESLLTADLVDVESQPLWPVLIETVHALVMYRYHKRYISTVLNEKPGITPKQLSLELRIPLGEALVILHELKTEQEAKPTTT